MNEVALREIIEVLKEIQKDKEGVEYEAMGVAIGAVGRQIPKNTISNMVGDYIFMHHCQICDVALDEKDNYCMVCGQKIGRSQK